MQTCVEIVFFDQVLDGLIALDIERGVPVPGFSELMGYFRTDDVGSPVVLWTNRIRIGILQDKSNIFEADIR